MLQAAGGLQEGQISQSTPPGLSQPSAPSPVLTGPPTEWGGRGRGALAAVGLGSRMRAPPWACSCGKGGDGNLGNLLAVRGEENAPPLWVRAVGCPPRLWAARQQAKLPTPHPRPAPWNLPPKPQKQN